MSERLLEAVKNRNLQKVKQYLDEGDDIHYRNDYSFRWAVGNGYFKIVELLLDRGADIHAFNDEALRLASYSDHVDVVKLLLDRGADRSANNYQALKWAKQRNHKKVIDILENYFPSSSSSSSSSSEQINQEIDLKTYNTDGRLTCYKCGNKLKQVVGFSGGNLNYCPNCE